MNRKTGKIVSALLGFSTLSIITAGIGFIIVPLSTRLIDAEDLGKINMLQSVVNILMPCMCLGFDHGYIRKYCELNRTKSKQLFSTSLFISILATLFLFMLSSLGWETITDAIVGERRFDVLIILEISTVTYIIERFLQMQHRLDNNVKKYAVVSIFFVFANKVIYVLAAFYFSGYIELLYVMALTEMIIAVILLFANRTLFVKQVCFTNEVLDSLRFGIPLMGAYVISQITQYIPKYFLRLNTGFANVGIFSTAATLASVITLMQSGFTLVWTPYVYENYETKSDIVNKLQETLVVALTIFASLIIVFQNLLVLIIGNKYRELTQYLPFLLMVPVFTSLGEITGIGINIAKKTTLHLLNNITAVIVTLFLSLILIPKYESLGAALAAAGGSGTLFLMRTFESMKLYMPVKNFKYIIVSCFSLILMGVLNCVLVGKTKVLYMSLGTILVLQIIVFYKPILNTLQYVKKGILKSK